LVMDRMLCLAAGSVAGGFARWLLSDFMIAPGSKLPWGTLVVNLSGCLLMGILHGLGENSSIMSVRGRMLLLVGFCGAFTTFSTWMLESSVLMDKGASRTALAYILVSVILGFAFLRAGAFLQGLRPFQTRPSRKSGDLRYSQPFSGRACTGSCLSLRYF